MNSVMAFMMGERNRGKMLMVFDWDKAAEIIREKKPEEASAYLKDDREWTGGVIYQNGEIVLDTYTYLASTWATPMLDIGEVNDIPCYRMEDQVPGWDSGTKWPQSAIDILEGKVGEIGVGSLQDS